MASEMIEEKGSSSGEHPDAKANSDPSAVKVSETDGDGKGLSMVNKDVIQGDQGSPADSDETDKKAAAERVVSRRVFVGNLAWQVSWQDLKDLMKTTGHEVTRSDIMRTPDGRSKGCGIVEFASPEGAKQAILTLNDRELKGRQIFVREDREEGRHSSAADHQSSEEKVVSDETNQSRRVYVGNLSWDVTWRELKDHMRQAGEVTQAEVLTEHNGRSKGCGIVVFQTEEQAKAAISTLTHTELNGRTIFVREDREVTVGARPSFGPSSAGKSSQNASVYVWNLSYETSWQDLKDHMRKAGNVEMATILTSVGGTSTGSGVVVYQKPSEAARAIRELQDSTLNGREIKIREDRSPAGGRGGGRGGGRFGGRGRGGGRSSGSGNPPSGLKLHVGNVTEEISWRDLKSHFEKCGDVDRVDVKHGFAIVRFLNKEDAAIAMKQLDGSDLNGCTLSVSLDRKP